MAFSIQVTSMYYDEGTDTWKDGEVVLVTKNSFTAAIDRGPRTQVRLNDGSSVMIKANLAAIETFLNS